MPKIGELNLRVIVVDSDYYALQSINGYLAWDRRTRVTHLARSISEVRLYLKKLPSSELPDVIVLDADIRDSNATIQQTIVQLGKQIPDIVVVCLAQVIHLQQIESLAQAGAKAVLLKQEVGLHIAWAICYALEQDFLITPSLTDIVSKSHNPKVYQASILPEQREYPEMTDRIKQAITLCVIEGMPAHLAADEMGISLHTIRGYIKDGYRILETYDETEYPVDMTPQERAFMRFTALAE